MRKIGEWKEAKPARVFGDYLAGQGIENEIREGAGAWAVWVYAEDDTARATQEYQAFAKDSSGKQYAAAAVSGEAKRKGQAAAPPVGTPQAQMPPVWRARPGLADIPLTVGLILLSVAVTAVTRFGADPVITSWVLCTSDGLARGEYWRLIAPIFLHLQWLHILLNMLWFKDLGGMVEMLRGRWFLLLLMAALAIPSNYAQLVMVGPAFGGMSGVVYGLLGYVWIKGRREPWSGFVMPETTVYFMLGWLVLCMTGMVGSIANWVHGVGLLGGIAAGFLDSLRRRGGLH